MSKSRDAFRTISEVSEALDTPAHVLRFWESKFSQVKPVKRAGGRRYYRPADIELLAGIKKILHDDGMTIKGAQKLLREQGVKHVAAIGADVLAVPQTDVVADDVTPAPEPVEEAPAPIEKAAASSDQTSVTDAPAPSDDPKPAVAVELTNVVAMPAAKPAGPRVSLDAVSRNEDPAASAEDAESEAPPEVEVADNEPEAAQDSAQDMAATVAAVPADPSDSDSKAPARLFHLLQKVPDGALEQRAADIAPLLARLRDVRARITAR